MVTFVSTSADLVPGQFVSRVDGVWQSHRLRLDWPLTRPSALAATTRVLPSTARALNRRFDSDIHNVEIF